MSFQASDVPDLIQRVTRARMRLSRAARIVVLRPDVYAALREYSRIHFGMESGPEHLSECRIVLDEMQIEEFVVREDA